MPQQAQPLKIPQSSNNAVEAPAFMLGKNRLQKKAALAAAVDDQSSSRKTSSPHIRPAP
jgi:hypothetical protein